MLSESGILAVANLINRTAGLLLLPVYTRWLSAADYGLYALVTSLLEVLSMILGAGLMQAMTRLYFDYPDGDRRRDRLVTTTLLLMLGALVLFSLSAPLLAGPLAMVLTGNPQHGAEIAAALPSVPSSVMLDILVGYFIVLKRPWAVLFLASVKAVSLITLNLLFLFVFDLGIRGVFAAQSLSFAAIALVGAGMVLWRLGPRFEFLMVRRLLRFGLPLVPSVVADAASSVAERWIVNHLLGAAALGAWALAQRVAYTIQAFLSTPFAQAFWVRRLEAFENGRSQGNLNRVLSGFLILLGLAVFSLSLFAPEIVWLLAPKGFEEAARILPLSALCVALAAVNLHVEIGMLLKKRSGLVSVISVSSLCVTLPAIWISIGLFGLAGAPLAQSCMLLIRIAVALRVNRRLGIAKIGTGWTRGFFVFVSLFAMGYLVMQLGTNDWLGQAGTTGWNPAQDWQVSLFKFAGLLGLAYLLFATSVMPKEFKAMALGRGQAATKQDKNR